jgi:hypothetical protein
MSKRPKLPLTEPFGNGEDPPATEVPVQWISVTPEEYDRILKECGYKTVDITPTHVEWGGSLRCNTSDGRNVNVAEELNRLEREKNG